MDSKIAELVFDRLSDDLVIAWRKSVVLDNRLSESLGGNNRICNTN